MSVMKRSTVALLVLLFLVLAGAAFAQPSDRDRDGIPDIRDRCPDAAGPLSNGGCPLQAAQPTSAPFQDRDSDGVADFVDACPDDAGTGFTNGCPLNVEPITLPGQQPGPQVIMVWDSTKVCMVGVPLSATEPVNVREEPSTSAPVIGQMGPGDQFEPWFRDYDENNGVWFGGAPAGGGYGWVSDSVVIDNGQCVNLPMVIHVDADGEGPLIVAEFDPSIIPEEQPDEGNDGWSLADLLKVAKLGDLILVFEPETGDATPTPTPEPGGRALPGLFKLDGLNIAFCDGSVRPSRDGQPAACDGSVMPTDQKPLPLAHRQKPGEECPLVGPGLCLDAFLLLPVFGDAEGQCSPDDFAKGLGLTGPDDPALIGLLLPAVQKVREAAAHASGDGGGAGDVMQDFHFRNLAGDGSVVPGGEVSDDPLGNGGFGPGSNVMQDFHFRTLLGDGSVVPGEDVLQDFHFRGPNTACAMTVFTPGAEAGAVDMFVVLLPAVQ